MPECIFCWSTTNSFKTKEHILPESLGGGDWAILRKDMFCDICQNKFGSEIEQQALSSYPFSFLRVLVGIPTKKGKAPWLKSKLEGVIKSMLKPGAIEVEPSVFRKEFFDNGTKSQMRLLAEPEKPEMICRFLLKMGIETIAMSRTREVFSKKFDSARVFALSGVKHQDWWFVFREDIVNANRFLKTELNREMGNWVELECITLENDEEIFHMKLLYLDFFVPLTANVLLSKSDFKAPEYRCFWV